jgi:beta-N-acetylhexosaminidase
MDDQRQWRTGRTATRLEAPRRATRPGIWVAVVVGLLAIGLGALAGVVLYLATASRAESIARGAVRVPASSAITPAPGALQPTGAVPPPRPADTTSMPTAPVPAAAAITTATPTPDRPLASPGATSDPRVEQALAQLRTDEDRIGQLLLLGWIGDSAEQARETLRELRPGGIVYVDNASTAAQATAINRALLAMAGEYGLPSPLIAVDHEGGIVQRIRDVPNLGSNREFGQRNPTDLEACERGRTHARQLRSMGFTVDLAPVLDVNNNPANPVIGSRSYGADAELVARLGSAYVRGLQGGGIVAVGKHFPGHGNTSVDSHLQLPILPHTLEQLGQVELVPFRRAIDPRTDIAAIMSAHIVFPALDPSRAPATLSRPIMTELLRRSLGFEGLIVSDDLAGMRAITDNFSPGEAAVRAVRAGVDMLIIGGGGTRQVDSRDALLAALADGRLSRERLDEAVRHVLRVKARFGLLDGTAPPEAGCS